MLIYARNTPFSVPKELLCYHSSFFEAAFEGPFAEGKSKQMILEDISPQLFELLLEWVRSREIVDGLGEIPSCRMLVELWILGDRFMMPAFQNDIIEALDQARQEDSPFTADLPHRIYEQTSEGSPLRAYLVDMSIEGTTGGFRESDPPQFLVDVINGMRIRNQMAKRATGEGTSTWVPSKKLMEIYHVEDHRALRRTRSRPMTE